MVSGDEFGTIRASKEDSSWLEVYAADGRVENWMEVAKQKREAIK
jgi:hypothetical protein